jgi:hypothetical protein
VEYSHANSANLADTGLLGIVAWLKYSHANSANLADTGRLGIVAWWK